MRDYEAKAAYVGEQPAVEPFPQMLDQAKRSVASVNSSLHELIDAIRGSRPEPASAPMDNQISKGRVLKEALEMTPGEIRELCERAQKQIAEIRQLLRV